MPHNNLTVQIMAGGESRRMGRDKALVSLGGKTLLERAIETWGGWGKELFLSVGGEERGKLAPAGTYPVFDRFPACGPLGGLHGGLAECRTEFLLLCAIDTPFLTREHAQRLLDAIGTADACVYAVEGKAKPLFGLYRKSCLSVAQTMLVQGELSIDRLLEMLHTVVLEAEEPEAFHSLDTPDELAAAQRSWTGR